MAMFAILCARGMFVADRFESRDRLGAANRFLRHQIDAALRCVSPRVRLRGFDRAFRVWMTRVWPILLGMTQVVQPESIVYAKTSSGDDLGFRGPNSLFARQNSLFRRNKSLFYFIGNLAESL